MKGLRLRDVLLPLVLVSVVASGLSFSDQRIWLIGRWVVLVLLAVHVLLSGRTLGTVNPAVVAAGIAYGLWCMATVAWSDVPTLSAAKVVALVLVGFAALWGGHQWIVSRSRSGSLDFLAPAAAVSLLASLLPGNGVQWGAENMPLYAGATVNPNHLGSIVAMSIPFAAWKLYRNRSAHKPRAFWLAILATYILVLYLSGSRASYFIFLGLTLGFLSALKLPRIIGVVIGIAWVGFLTAMVFPEASSSWVQRNIYKQPDAGISASVFDRRTRYWEESYDAALMGGWFGLGYGVSADSDPSMLVSAFTTQGYGREKGNSQLAIIEETGIVGLVLHGILLVVLFWRLWSALRMATGESRILLGLVVGTLLGMMAQATAEAWWVAPGSPEFVFFWVMAGAGLGITRMIRVNVARVPNRAVIAA